MNVWRFEEEMGEEDFTISKGKDHSYLEGGFSKTIKRFCSLTSMDLFQKGYGFGMSM
jgi:hypothetical protein